MPDADLGTLTHAGDDVVLTFTRRYAHSVEKVWRAVTEPEHLSVWFPDTIVGAFAPGATLRFVTAPDSDEGFDGEVLVFDPPKRLELRWGTDHLAIALEPDGDGTVMTFTDTFAELGKAARDGAGWHECLDRLTRELDGAPSAEWGTGYKVVHPAYVAALGPEGSAIGPPPGWDDASE
jgi:uncharacterized protein YndB with AHSA1/START domain